MDVKLVVVGGDAKPTEIKLKLPAIIGRGRSASLTLPHPLVSRQHCELYESGGKLFVRDMGSLNGTFVGEEKIDEAALDSGSLLTIGNVTFRPIYGDQPPAVEEPEEIDFDMADDSAGDDAVEFDFVDEAGVDDAEVEEIDDADLEDVEIEEIDDVEVAGDDEVEEIDDVDEIEEPDPLDPPGMKLDQTLPAPESKPKGSNQPTEKAPPPKKASDQDDQFLQFLDDDDEEEDSSDDDDLNSFLKDFK